ncbi:MAG: polysaccharide deacetylase family protein [Chitinophagaceae bacterium]|nr:polysaccharide deacetylase family protein [Chitinophagaceae bacterium]
MAYCKKHYAVILPSQWNEKTALPKMVITIDDGFHDFMEYALPILADNNLPAVHNVLISSIINNQVNWTYRLNLIVEDHLKSKKNFSLTEYMIPYRMIVTQNNAPKVALETMLLLKDLPLPQTEKILSQLEQFCESDLYYPKMMNESDLKSCEAAGIEIGSHGWTHILLKGSLGAEILKHEIVESKIALEKMLGHEVECFAFPAGQYDNEVVNYTRQAGYKYIFAAGDQFFHPTNTDTVPVLFPRITPSAGNIDMNILKIESLNLLLKNKLSAHGQE